MRIVFSDASDTGYSGYIVEHSCYAANGLWEDFVKTKSSTWRELVAVSECLQTLQADWLGRGSAGTQTIRMPHECFQ